MYTLANKIQITMLSDHLLNFFFSKSNIYKMYVLHRLSKWMGKNVLHHLTLRTMQS